LLDLFKLVQPGVQKSTLGARWASAIGQLKDAYGTVTKYISPQNEIYGPSGDRPVSLACANLPLKEAQNLEKAVGLVRLMH
jgi:hypothetical protein